MDWKEIVKDIEMKDEMREELLSNCKRSKHVKNVLFRYSKAAAVFIGLAVCSMGSLTAYAAVSAYRARMEAMSKEEVQTHYETEMIGKGEVYRYSRPLSDSEEKRLDTLRQEYENGRFPEGKISKENIDNGVYYNMENRTYMLPDRELTDEEILQILDMWAKVDYSLQQINKEKEEAGELETIAFVEKEVEVTAENAPYIYGREIVERVYDINLEDCEPEVTYTTPDYEPGSDGYYEVSFKNDDGKYVIRFRVYSGEMSKVPACFYSFDNEETQEEETVEITEAENYPVANLKEELVLEKICEDSKRIVTEGMGIEENIVRVYCAYLSEEEAIGSIYVVIETESRERFKLRYTTQDGQNMQFDMLTTYGKETYEVNKLFEEGGQYADIYEVVEIE